MVEVNDIVQIKPEHEWGGCLLIVTEVKSFGCQGYVEIPKQGAAYIRLNKEDYVKVGQAEFVRSSLN